MSNVIPFDREPKAEPRLLRVLEAAKILQLSPRKVQYMCKSSELPYVPFGRAIRIDRADILSLINKRKQGGAG